jgi:hypothetical protein
VLLYHQQLELELRLTGPDRRRTDPWACREGHGPQPSPNCRAISGRAILVAKSFEIVVKGRLSPTLMAAVDGFEVSHCDHGLTHLVGWVPDQSRLHSTFELLRDLNIELVSVNPVQLPEPGEPEGQPGTVRGNSNGS